MCLDCGRKPPQVIWVMLTIIQLTKKNKKQNKTWLNAVPCTVCLLKGVQYLYQQSHHIPLPVLIPSRLCDNMMSFYCCMSCFIAYSWSSIFIFIFSAGHVFADFWKGYLFSKTRDVIMFYQTFLSNMAMLLEKKIWLFEWLRSWTVSFTNFVAMVTLHSGTPAKAVEDKLPICHMLAL